MLGVLAFTFGRDGVSPTLLVSVIVLLIASQFGYFGAKLAVRAFGDTAVVAASISGILIRSTFDEFDFPLSVLSSAKIEMIEGDGTKDETLVFELAERVKAKFGLMSLIVSTIGTNKIMIPTRMLSHSKPEVTKFLSDLETMRADARKSHESSANRSHSHQNSNFDPDAIISNYLASRHAPAPNAQKRIFGQKA